MARLSNQLNTGERVIVRARIHPIVYLVPRTLFFATLTLGLYWIYVFLKVHTQEGAVTDKRLIATRGFLGVETMYILNKNIQDVQIDQTFWGRLFGYGTVMVSGTGTDYVVFPYIRSAQPFVQAIAALSM